MLYRIYRPKTFAEIEGQEHIVRTLRGALSSGRPGHAYFFAGPRGTGKTTMARLFAKALNCEKRPKGVASNDKIEPCNKCASCTEINAGRSLDLIEIDAASNRGIDEIRSLKDSAGVAASSSSYKIFIVDEVHMLTTPAFNALLKTLEEPPSHTIFILATTEPHKVPATILSRVQRFDFKKLSSAEISTKLRKIAKAEKLALDDASVELLTTYASGSLRDAESALAKMMAYAGSKITGEQTSAILGIIPAHVHAALLDAIFQKKPDIALAQIEALHTEGMNLEQFTKQFIEHTRAELMTTIQSPRPDGRGAPFLVRVLQELMQARTAIKASPIPQLPLELAIVELTQS